MLNIGICDDEKIIVALLKKMLQDCLEELGIKGQISEFYSGEELLKNLNEEELLFLDIKMPGLNGIEIGGLLRDKKNDCKIIVATGWTEYFKDAFKIGAFRFVTKPFQKEEIKEALEAVLKTKLGIETIELYRERNMYTFFQKEIIYMTAASSAVEFMLKGEVFRKETSLAELEKILDNRLFYRISKRCIVNLAKIELYESGTILLDGVEFKVSVRKRKDFEKRYLIFLMNFK